MGVYVSCCQRLQALTDGITVRSVPRVKIPVQLTQVRP